MDIDDADDLNLPLRNARASNLEWSPDPEVRSAYARPPRRRSPAGSASVVDEDYEDVLDYDQEGEDEDDLFGFGFGKTGAWVANRGTRASSTPGAGGSVGGSDLDDAFANNMWGDEDVEPLHARPARPPSSARSSSRETTSTNYVMDRNQRTGGGAGAGDDTGDEVEDDRADALLVGVFADRRQEKTIARSTQAVRLGGITRMRSEASRKKEAGIASASGDELYSTELSKLTAVADEADSNLPCLVEQTATAVNIRRAELSQSSKCLGKLLIYTEKLEILTAFAGMPK